MGYMFQIFLRHRNALDMTKGGLKDHPFFYPIEREIKSMYYIL